jgi:hypothetical protein
MNKLALSVCLMALFALSSPVAADWDVSKLMQSLASQKGGQARFVERKFIALLDKPVVSSGELAFTAPDRLEKRTLLPKPELFSLDRDTLRMERGRQKYTLRLSDYPEVMAFVDSIRGTLAGDQKKLERSYALRLSGSPESWSLMLLPSDQRIAAHVLRIVISGTRHQVHTIEYLQADGDRAVMSIEPVPPVKAP